MSGLTEWLGELFHVESVVPESFAGSVCFYLVTAVEVQTPLGKNLYDRGSREHRGKFMQFAKDSFFPALQQRLAGVNRTGPYGDIERDYQFQRSSWWRICQSFAAPNRIRFTLSGVLPDVIAGSGGRSTLMSMDVVISYYTMGSVQSMVDRGRLLAELDDELLSICQPRAQRRGISRKRRARTWERRFSGIRRHSAKGKAQGDFGGESRFRSARRVASPKTLRATRMGE